MAKKVQRMLGSLTVVLPSNVDQQIPQGLIVVLEKKIGENLIYCCLCFCNPSQFGWRTFLSAFAERDNWMALDKLLDAFCKLGN